MRSIELDILNASGLHARPVALFVRTGAPAVRQMARPLLERAAVA